MSLLRLALSLQQYEYASAWHLPPKPPDPRVFFNFLPLPSASLAITTLQEEDPGCGLSQDQPRSQTYI